MHYILRTNQTAVTYEISRGALRVRLVINIEQGAYAIFNEKGGAEFSFQNQGKHSFKHRMYLMEVLQRAHVLANDVLEAAKI